jgi:O-antigen/teichoic acid export membrane protein
VAGYIAGVLVSLAAATILVRHLGVPAFGRYVTVTSLVALVGGVTEAGTYVYGIREFTHRGEPGRRAFMADLLGMRLALTVAGVGCATVFALAVGYEHALILGTLVAGAGLLAQVTSDVLSISLQAQLQLGRLTAVDLIRRLLALLFIGVLALAGARLLPLLAAQAAAGVLAMGLLAWLVRSSVRLRLSLDWRAWRSLLRDTSLFAIAMSIGAIYFYVTVVLMSLIASSTQTGYFATSFRVTQVALGIPVLLLTAIFPLMSQERLDEDAGTIGRVFDVAVMCGVGLSLAIALGAHFMIDVIAGSKGRGAVSVLQIQGVVLTASFISASSSLRLISLRRYRPLIFASASALAVDIGLGLALIPGLGARGGALADVITEVLVAVGLTSAVMRAVPRHGINASVVAPTLLAAGLASTMWLVPMGSLPRVLAGSVVYFGVLLLTRAVPDELTRALPRVRALRMRS